MTESMQNFIDRVSSQYIKEKKKSKKRYIPNYADKLDGELAKYGLTEGIYGWQQLNYKQWLRIYNDTTEKDFILNKCLKIGIIEFRDTVHRNYCMALMNDKNWST
jgi:hypothetical protein